TGSTSRSACPPAFSSTSPTPLPAEVSFHRPSPRCNSAMCLSPGSKPGKATLAARLSSFPEGRHDLHPIRRKAGNGSGRDVLRWLRFGGVEPVIGGLPASEVDRLEPLWVQLLVHHDQYAALGGPGRGQAAHSPSDPARRA